MPRGARALPPQAHADRVALAALWRAHGSAALSGRALDPARQILWTQAPQPAGAVVYTEAAGAWVGVCEPLCPPADRPAVAAAFVAAARAHGCRAAFFAAEGTWAADAGMRALPLGRQPCWVPARWPAVRAGRPQIGRQLARARSHGVSVVPLDPAAAAAADPALVAAVATLRRRWLQRHPLPPMGFVVTSTPPAELLRAAAPDLDGPDASRVPRDVYLAWRRHPDGPPELVGLAAAVSIPGRAGVLLDEMWRSPSAPNGTAELMVDAVLGAAAAAGRATVTLGLVALDGPLPWPLRLARRLGEGLYGFAGLAQFRAKLAPDAWEPVHLVYPADAGALPVLAATLAAFAPQGLPRFAWDALGRGPPLLFTGLAVTLVPWTAALALADGTAWFGHAWLQAAWVAFDVALMTSLWWMARRRRPAAVAALAALVTVDAALTALEVWWVPPPAAVGAGVVRAVAVVGPAVAALCLWRAWLHLRGPR